MICPKCKREVTTLHGNGEYPNSSYKCSKCCDDETGAVISGFFKVLGLFILLSIIVFIIF